MAGGEHESEAAHGAVDRIGRSSEGNHRMRRFRLAALAAGTLTLSITGLAQAGGPPHVGFYVDGDQYRTVGTPTDFADSGAPAHTYDAIYALGGGLLGVAEAKPGDRDFNGGRWQVFGVEWHVSPYQLTSAEDVRAAHDLGELTIAGEPMRSFECPVIPVGEGG